MLDGVNIMFNKKISLVLITLVFMLSLSVVSAVDSNGTDDVIAGEVDEEPPSVGVSDIYESEDILAADSNNNYKFSSNSNGTYYSGGSYDFILFNNNAPVENASVTLNVNGVEYTLNTDASGKVSALLNLSAGTYKVSASYKDVSSMDNVKVLPLVSGKDLTKIYKSTAPYTATFLKNNGKVLKNTNVKFILNGKTYTKKTNSKGVASIGIGLGVGTYTIYAVHPDGYTTSNKIVVKTSVIASDLSKRYLSSKVFSATFYGKNGKLLANKYVTFKAHGSAFKVRTNSKGVAKLSVISKPATFKIYSINPETGEQKTNTVKISPTMTASKMTVFSDRTSTFKVTLYKNEKLVKNAKVYVYIKNSKKTLKTDAKGVASVNFKLAKGTYTFKSYDPYTQSSINTKITVISPTIKANNIVAPSNKLSVYTVTLLKQNGNVAGNSDVQITFNGQTNIYKTNANGAATISFNLTEGTYKINCKDLSNNYTLTRTITVYESNIGTSYNQYGVSEDGYSILAIGRASSAGEYSKYGYTFYMTEFDRTCPYCHSHELYWSIFFAGSEIANWGKFPATGNVEGSSAEGIIVCANCDSDWSVFGHNHGGSGGDLTPTSPTTSCTKQDAYTLKSGKFVKS